MILNHDWLLFGTIDLVVRAIGIIYSAHAIMHVRTSQAAIAWIMGLVIFPYITVPLYLVLGRRKFHGYAAAQRAAMRKVDSDLRKKIHRELTCHITPQDDRLQPLQQSCAQIARFDFTQGNDTRLLINGDATFAAIIDAIKNAKQYILMQYFIVKNDKIGNIVRMQLCAKAKQGVRIYFIYDEIGSRRLSKHYLQSLKDAGIAVHSFHTRKGRGNRFQINFRNHRKIIITDGEQAFIGGMNLGDEYRSLSTRFGFWRDTFVRLQGPCVLQLQLSVLRDWYWVSGNILDLNWQAKPHPNNHCSMMMPTGPADAFTSGTLLFCEIINLAKRRLWIASPYFVPETTIQTALQLATLRGVDVRILLPSRPDHKLVYLCAFSYYDMLKQSGIKLYRYRQGFMHQKAFLVDDTLAGIGTANLDNRSLRINFEITGLFASPQPIQDIADMLNDDINASDEVDLSIFPQRAYLFRLMVRSAKLFSPIL